MNDALKLTLTDRALARLRMLGEGNGLASDAFNLIEKTEDIYTLEGSLRLTPEMSIQPLAYTGSVRPTKSREKSKQVLSGFAALKEEVDLLRKNFLESREWMPEAIKELKDEPGHGWGHDGGKMAFPEHSKTLAATEKCPLCFGSGQRICEQCQGRAQVLCSYCHGNKQEPCYHCYGKGVDPAYPDQPCTICHGTNYAPCRYCRATAYLPCPNCHGRGNKPCPDCEGKGSVTQEVEMKAGAAVNFSVASGRNLPSGLLRSLDRAGMTNLITRGHGDIEMMEPDAQDPDAVKRGITLRAKIPYADMKLVINGKAVMAGVFGKNALLTGIPAFLDEPLKTWRERLARAAAGSAPLDKALGARALREALDLCLRGKGQLQEMRRLYPVGLSPKTAEEILKNTSLALKQQTLRARVYAAVFCLAASAGIFAGYFLTPAHALLAHVIPPRVVLVLDALLPILVIGLSGLGLAHTAKWTLKRRYPKADINLGQSIGKIGYVTLAGILAVYGFILVFGKYV